MPVRTLQSMIGHFIPTTTQSTVRFRQARGDDNDETLPTTTQSTVRFRQARGDDNDETLEGSQTGKGEE